MEKISTYKELKNYIKSAEYNSPNSFGEEGEDHINISLQSNNDLGRMLDPAYSYKLNYPLIGNFKSILVMMYWLKDKKHNDLFRTVKMKDLYVLVKMADLTSIENYKVIILHATYLKIKSQPNLIKMIKNLPDDIRILSYRKAKGTRLRITTDYASTAVPIMEEIINSIKEDRSPNYKAFMTAKGTVEKGFLEFMFGE